MTEAGWTRTKPTVAGWYWWRTNAKDEKPWVVKVQRLDMGMMQMWRIGCDRPVIIGDGGEWLGPLSPDSYQQGRVAGMREAEEYALRCLKELQDKIRDLESGKCVLAGAQTKKGVEA